MTRHRRAIAAVLSTLAVLVSAGCATTPSKPIGAAGGVLDVVASENVWGSLAAQLGGEHVKVTNIIDHPGTDPHEYEPTAADGKAIALAGMVIVNGVGYDAWASKLVDANPSSARRLLDVGDLVGAKPGDNPHRWYNPDDVRRVLDQITADFSAADPAHAGYFAARHDTVLGTDLKGYFDLITEIKTRFAGTPVGASESIFAMLAPSLGLDLRTPSAFLTAISEGSDPSAADKATIDAQISGRQIAVYVLNSQNATPDVQAQVSQAKANHIPVTTITETLTPAGASFQQWQVAQLIALRAALIQATGE